MACDVPSGPLWLAGAGDNLKLDLSGIELWPQ